jgi:hypothetical protein
LGTGEREYAGLLCIGDPHLASRVPGFRKDDYPQTALEKLRWTLGYASENALLPVLLGDLFHRPRDNANWLLVRLMALFTDEVVTVVGNHDCRENSLGENDTLAILCAAGKVRLLDPDGPYGGGPWVGHLNGVPVAVGGTNWGNRLPGVVDRDDLFPAQEKGFVFWITHDDFRFPGWEERARYDCREVPGIDCVVNGHVHKAFPRVQAGTTTWLNPGNIARLERSPDCLRHTPAALRIDTHPGGWTASPVEIPHRPFDDVFYERVEEAVFPEHESSFVKGLEELQQVRTAGEGLTAFLKKNLEPYSLPVRETILRLAKEVIEEP